MNITAEPQPAEWHIVTCEYAPRVGGVSDHTQALATGLATAGHRVHVWCSTDALATPTHESVVVHPEFERFTPRELVHVGSLLDQTSSPRRLFVQWVPHGYGFRSLNVPFVLWLAWRALIRGDELQLMVHEPFLEFSGHPLQYAAAVVHRFMLGAACIGASRVWVSISSWIPRVRPYILRGIPVRWLPVPAPDLREASAAEANAVRQLMAPPQTPLVGHFGTYSSLVTALLEPALDVILQQSNAHVLLIGRDSKEFFQRFLGSRPLAAGRIRATGALDPAILPHHLRACDLMIQPYPDGISARRTSALASMAHGIPVVTNSGHLTESFWLTSPAVVLVAEPDGSSIGRAGVALLGDAERRRHLSVAARDVYDQMFDVRHAVRLLETAA